MKKSSELVLDLLSYDIGREKPDMFNIFEEGPLKLNNALLPYCDNQSSMFRAYDSRATRNMLSNAIISALKIRSENELFREEQLLEPNFLNLHF